MTVMIDDNVKIENQFILENNNMTIRLPNDEVETINLNIFVDCTKN